MFLPLGAEDGAADLVGAQTGVVGQKLVFLLVLGDDVDGLLDAVEGLFQVFDLS